ncbi:MAG: rRNA maturation RNase YbeY [Balneolaceae bacterium]
MMKNFPDLPADERKGKLSFNNTSGIDLPVDESDLHRLLQAIEREEKISFRHVELVYIDEDEITEINRKHLDKDYITDTISFRYDDDNNQAIEGTLYGCAPRIAEQSKEFDADPQNEFYRIFIHGLLHLAGYNDKTEEEKKTMTDLENRYLSVLNFPL